MKKDNQVAERLLKSAAKLFLEKDFHSVSIRMIAEDAGTSSGMIKYYFNSKYGLFEEMLKQEYGKILTILHEIIRQEELLDFPHIIRRVLDVYHSDPNIPKFIVRTWMFKQSAGSRFLLDSFEFEKRLVHQWVEEVIEEGKVDRNVDSEVVRIAFMSLTLLPSMMQDLLAKSYGEEEYQQFLNHYADFCGNMLLSGVKPKSTKSKN
ncbi:TetR/AcrR family transcriptional regulator [Photobacterium sp. OFAV2-7]|uniref:TetR/AcrR family transcriptional regulator n=1 Tax=Photobacterium sp. OFAV2-7 TaxID=2917748 RepID=UPI001EF632DA|nr:TetR/AcrR family transcriptional regulator [Photobacterium sp. OFAV2-7]MCG7588514.1 TetR/AcrR family transcriptional regulator [Photobacterium sp. OFAV2-7]